MSEIDEIYRRYERRQAAGGSLYNPLHQYNLMVWQEKIRAIRDFLVDRKVDCHTAKVLEVGCGSGTNLVDLIRLGFKPPNCFGNELLESRLVTARQSTPPGVTLWSGDASIMDVPEASFDIVYQSTVFSSILDLEFQERLARVMWRWVRPGGAILWYDFVYNNPKNPDVRGVGSGRVKELFPDGIYHSKRVTLAPPLGRRVAAVDRSFYGIFNAVPWLRTHLLCWIEKPLPRTI